MLEQEKRIPSLKLPLVIEFAKKNNINKVIWNHGFKNIGIVATGKAYADTLECFDSLNINEKKAPPEDAEKWQNVKDKYNKHFSDKPGR